MSAGGARVKRFPARGVRFRAVSVWQGAQVSPETTKGRPKAAPCVTFPPSKFSREGSWSGRGDSNARPLPWQGNARPLSYARPLGGGGDLESPAPVCKRKTHLSHRNLRRGVPRHAFEEQSCRRGGAAPCRDPQHHRAFCHVGACPRHRLRPAGGGPSRTPCMHDAASCRFCPFAWPARTCLHRLGARSDDGRALYMASERVPQSFGSGCSTGPPFSTQSVKPSRRWAASNPMSCSVATASAERQPLAQ